MVPIGSGKSDRFTSAFACAEFRALFAAYTVSTAGDQFARVALSVLVFDRSGSPLWTALTYALTFLPDLVGGPLLAGLADRYPRRRVMVTADTIRAALVAAMAIPGLALPLVAALLVVVQLAGAPATAARGALTPEILPGELYPQGQAALSSAGQAAQVIGFVGGGVLVAAIGTSGVLWADAGTFAASALLVAIGIERRPAAAANTDVVRRGWWSDLRTGTTLMWTTPRLRTLVAFACLTGFYIVGEALAAPYAAKLGGAAVLVGLLFAGYAVGAATGMLVVARFPADIRLRMMPPLAAASCLPLVACLLNPGPAWVIVLFILSGLGSSYQFVAMTTFTQTVPSDRRGQAFGLASTALKVTQGLGVAAAGAAADLLAPHIVVAAAGVFGVLAAVAVTRMWRKAASSAAPAARPTTAIDPG